MIEHRDDLAARRARRAWLRQDECVDDEPPDVGPGATPHAAAAQRTARWADRLAAVLRAEIHDAERRGVISVGQGEQLLARLVVVVDQAVSPSG
ncbi:MAG: hypothetical protein AB7J32_25720 [Pseudonocardia sp.]